MIRAFSVLALFVSALSCLGFMDPIDMNQYAAQMNRYQVPHHCSYHFSLDRNSVQIKYTDENSVIECTFTHSDRVQIPPESTSVINAVYYHNYTCSDNTRAVYSSNWVGMTYTFWHYPGGEDSRISCD